MIRFARIVGIASLLALLFRLSREATASWGEDQAPGYTVAVGIVSGLFLVRAAVSEFVPPKGRPVPEHERDILWGLSLGAFVSLVARLATF